MVTTASSVIQPHTIIRPIRVIAPVVDKDPNTSKARLRAFDTAVIWLAQRAVECGGNLVIAATFEEVAPETRDESGRVKRSLVEVVATGTCVRVIDHQAGTISAALGKSKPAAATQRATAKSGGDEHDCDMRGRWRLTLVVVAMAALNLYAVCLVRRTLSLLATPTREHVIERLRQTDAAATAREHATR
jgi:hypothetical protein